MLKHPKSARVIFHVDMNSFYASVEIACDPSLRGKPVAIAGNVEERKGIIVTSSYEARAKGVQTTMPLWEAKKKCPDLVVLPPSFERYRTASEKMFTLLAEFSNLVEPISIDEGYIDLTDASLLRSPIEIANEIQERLLSTLYLPCSIGIAPNKFLAKMASEMKKPLGITILRKRELHQKLWPLPIEKMYGVGKKTMERFHKLNVYTIGDLARKDSMSIRLQLGRNGEKLWQRSTGLDERAVNPKASRQFKSIGTSTTLPKNLTNVEEIMIVLSELAESLEVRLQRKKAVATSIQIAIRYADRKTITRSCTLKNPIQSKKELLRVSKPLIKENWNEKPIRLLGLTAIQVVEKKLAYRQLDLFSYQSYSDEEQLVDTVEEEQAGEDVSDCREEEGD